MFLTLNYPLYCIDISKKDELIAIGGGGGTSKTGISNIITILKKKDNLLQEILKIDIQIDTVKCLIFHPNQSFLVCGVGNFSVIYEYQDNNFKKIKSIQTNFSNEGELRVVKFNDVGNLLATGGSDGILRFWSFPEMNLIKKFTDENDKSLKEIDQINFDIINNYVLVTTKFECKFWNIPEDNCIKKISLNEYYKKKSIIFRGSIYSPCGKYLYIGKIAPGMRSWIVKYKILNSETNKFLIQEMYSIIAHKYIHHNVIKLSFGGELIATGTGDSCIAIFKTSNLNKLIEIKHIHSLFITDIYFTKDDKSIISISPSSTCFLTEIKNNTLNKLFFIFFFFILSFIILLFSIWYYL